jgi:alkyl hydroperoxide reductase subunit D
MDFATLAERIPDALRDTRINLSAIERVETLTPGQLWGTVVASALATRNADVIRAAAEEARKRVDAATVEAARTAAGLMAMNNIYYRFRHLVDDREFDNIPARLRMQGMQTHGAPAADFELWCTAVSAINGCGMCVNAHVAKLKGAGVSREAIHDAVRVASILFAAASALDGAAALPAG